MLEQTALEQTQNNFRLWDIIRRDPVLPSDVIGYIWSNGCKGVVSTDTHLMNDEYRGIWNIAVRHVEGDSFAVVWLKRVDARVVDKHELLNLFLVNA